MEMLDVDRAHRRGPYFAGATRYREHAVVGDAVITRAGELVDRLDVDDDRVVARVRVGAEVLARGCRYVERPYSGSAMPLV
jgi:hypothetical protein